MTTFSVEMPFAYRIDLRRKRARTFETRILVERTTCEIPRIDPDEAPVVMRSTVGEREAVEYRHDGRSFLKPFEPFNRGVTEEDLVRILAPGHHGGLMDEYPLPSIPHPKNRYGASGEHVMTNPRSTLAYWQTATDPTWVETRNSTLEEARADAVAAARGELRSIDGRIFVRCDEPVYVVYLEGARSIEGPPKVSISCWHDRDMKTCNLNVPVAADARGSLEIVTGNRTDELVDRSVFRFDPVSGNRRMLQALAREAISRMPDADSTARLRQLVDLCDLAEAGTNEEILDVVARVGDWKYDYEGFEPRRDLMVVRRLLGTMGLVGPSSVRKAEDVDMDALGMSL